MRSMVLITGATGGLGKAFAVECARRGFDLFLTDLPGSRLQPLAAGLERTYGVCVQTAPSDLTDAEERLRLTEALRGSPLSFRGLINVAGTDFEGLFRDRSPNQLRTIVRLNVEATLELTHALLRKMDPSVPFRIVNVSSLAAFFPMPVKATYAASKRFLVDFSLALRDELRLEGATVTVLCPAGLPTTADCIEAIEAQGLMGQLTTLNIGAVAAGTLDHALAGRPLFIPGRLNRWIHWLGRLVPRVTVSEWIGKRWRHSHRRRFDPGAGLTQQLTEDYGLDLAP